jgi:tungstate transport system substrate-binding protein
MKTKIRCVKGPLGLGLAIAGLSALLGCSSSPNRPDRAAGKTEKPALAETIVLATTTSTRDTGLLDVLLPAFKAKTGIEVKAVAVGSGQALELGRRGDADVLLTHSPAAEEKFMAEGYGQSRRPLMYNDFVIVGPASDPAKLQGAASAKEVFARLAQTKSPFVSRGDQSGTHVKELQLWDAAKIKPEGPWYVQAGTGMGEALRMANEKKAYTLCDRATFLSQQKSLELKVAYEGDPALKNHYSVIVVSPEKNPKVRRDAAVKFAEFLLSPEGGKMLSQYGVSKFGQQLFFLEPTSSEEGKERH